jgi:hypothetical protein
MGSVGKYSELGSSSGSEVLVPFSLIADILARRDGEITERTKELEAVRPDRFSTPAEIDHHIEQVALVAGERTMLEAIAEDLVSLLPQEPNHEPTS